MSHFNQSAMPSFIGTPSMNPVEATPSFVSFNGSSFNVPNNGTMTADQKFHPQNTPNGSLPYELADQDDQEELNGFDQITAPSQQITVPFENVPSNGSNYSALLPPLTNESVSAVPQFTNETRDVSFSADDMFNACQIQNSELCLLPLDSLNSIIFDFQSKIAIQPQFWPFWNCPENGFISPQQMCPASPLKFNEKCGFKPMYFNPNSTPVNDQYQTPTSTPAYTDTLARYAQKLKEVLTSICVEKRFIPADVEAVFIKIDDKVICDEAIRVLENIEESANPKSALKDFHRIMKIDSKQTFMREMRKLHDENLFVFGEIMAANAFSQYRSMPKSSDSDYSVCEKLLKWAVKLMIFSAENMNRAMTLCGGNGLQLKFKNKLVKTKRWDAFWNGLLEILEKNPPLAENVQFDVKFSKETKKGSQNRYNAHCALKTLGGNCYLEVNKGFEAEFIKKTEQLREECDVFFVGWENEKRAEKLRRLEKEKTNKASKKDEPLFKFEARRLYKTTDVCKLVKSFESQNIKYRNVTEKVEGCQLVKCIVDDLDNFSELRKHLYGLDDIAPDLDDKFAAHMRKNATYCGLVAGSQNNVAKLTHKLLVTFIVSNEDVPFYKKCLKPFDAEGQLEEFMKSDPVKRKSNKFRACEENFFLNKDGELVEHLDTLVQIKEFVAELGISHTEQAELAGGETYLCENMTLEKMEQIRSWKNFNSEWVEATAAKFNTKKQKEDILGFGEASVSFSIRLRPGFNEFRPELEIHGFKEDVAVQIRDEFFARTDKNQDKNQEPFCVGCVSCRSFYAPARKDQPKAKKKRRKNRRNQRKNRK